MSCPGSLPASTWVIPLLMQKLQKLVISDQVMWKLRELPILKEIMTWFKNSILHIQVLLMKSIKSRTPTSMAQFYGSWPLQMCRNLKKLGIFLSEGCLTCPEKPIVTCYSKVSGTFLIHFNFDTFLVDFLVLYLEDFCRFSGTFSLDLLKIWFFLTLNKSIYYSVQLGFDFDLWISFWFWLWIGKGGGKFFPLIILYDCTKVTYWVWASYVPMNWLKSLCGGWWVGV